MSKPLRIAAIILIVGLVGFFVLRWLVQQVSPMPDNLGAVDGRFTPCPNSPNCVSTQVGDALHAIDPIPYAGSTQAAHDRLLDIINDLPRTTIVSDKPTYIHAEFRSNVWRFVDDVEFYFDEETQTIQFRSASRLGYGDAGVNRSRMEQIRELFGTG